MPEREAVDLRWVLAVIRRWLWLIFLCTLLGVGGAYGVSRYMPPVYTASATLLIQAAVTDFQAIMTSERLANTYSQLLKERTALDTVIEQARLDETPITLARKISVGPVPQTQLIRITVEYDNPDTAALIANTLADAFIQQVEIFQTERYSDSLTSIKEQIDKLTEQMDTTQAKIDILGTPRFPDDQAELARQEGLMAEYRGAYTTLLQSYEQMRLNAAQSVQTMVVAESARVPQEPTQHLILYMALAGLVGALMGTGAAFLLEYLNDTIKTAEDVRRTLGLKTLGTIGALSRTQRKTLVATELVSAHGEAYRVLGTNICFSETDMPLRTVLVTSPSASEGKSLTAANLAAALTQSGLQVILVEGDMRRPTVRQYLDIEPHSEGLSTALAQGELDNQLRPTNIEGLSLLDSGQAPTNPMRLLGSQNLADLLRDLARRADVVVIDSPPVLPVADAMLLARHVDGVLLVLRAGQTRWPAARQAMERLRQVRAHLAGVVLNGVPTRGGGYYGGYYYSSYHATDSNGHRRSKRSSASDDHDKPSGRTSSRRLPSWLSGRRQKSKEEPSSPASHDVAKSPAPQDLPQTDRSPAALPASPTRSQPAEPHPLVEPSAQRDLAETRLIYLFLSAVASPSSGATLLAAWGIREDGRMMPLHAEAGDQESPEGWDGLLEGLRRRGLEPPLLVIADGWPALTQAVARIFPQSMRQRCLTHAMNDLVSQAPAAIRAEIKTAVQAAYNAPDRKAAELLVRSFRRVYGATLPALVEALEKDWEACVSYMRFPRTHRRFIRTAAFLGRALRDKRRRGHSVTEDSGRGEGLALIQAIQRWPSIPMGKREITEVNALRMELSAASGQTGAPAEAGDASQAPEPLGPQLQSYGG